ncbi:MAG: transcription termination/antitermination protein NusA [Candidatus Omnitrophica bacterium]|nr:transcription termination/antitermination protein NusA [Candidatus Omnitrophota bacterium]
MNGELIAILEQIERDKGIDRNVLLQAVESALVSAAKRVWKDVDPEAEIKVELDKETGKIRAFAGNKEIKSKDFGRIAAQTAKQVIIQKIREAEKDVIFGEFQGRVGQIVSGSVYRFERGNIIVDLNKTEGFIPKSEQSIKEEFHQGERIRSYVIDVKKESKGPQIVLSRTHPNLVRKLFELEVPEIYESIVEIKAIAREPGERTKIAVWSKDEKVDCVGACVGMRGQRVKNIVMELHGEKIDIVRWSEDNNDFVVAALSPAKIQKITFDKEAHRAQVIVPEDQLSLAIGKHGQNVRLASKLTGWELDIRTEETKEEKEPKEKKETKQKKEKTPVKKKIELTALAGVGAKLSDNLKEAGFDSLEKLAKTNIEELSKIKGLGKKKAEGIIEEAIKLTTETEKEA